MIPQKGKTRISIFIDNAVLDAFRARAEQAGIGYQTMMNDVLKRAIAESDQPLTEGTLRQILREEMPDYVRPDQGKTLTCCSQAGSRLDQKLRFHEASPP